MQIPKTSSPNYRYDAGPSNFYPRSVAPIQQSPKSKTNSSQKNRLEMSAQKPTDNWEPSSSSASLSLNPFNLKSRSVVSSEIIPIIEEQR